MTKNQRNRFTLFLVVLSLIISVYLAQGLFQQHNGSGCPADFENTTENAQVFLMGTIGGAWSDPNRDCWREHVIQPELDELGVTYYNPVMEDWSEENAREEAEAIKNAETIVLVITENHASIGSLAESGWAVLSAIERDQTIIVYIENASDNPDSLRARKIVLSQATTLAPSIDEFILVDDMDGVIETLRQVYGQ